MGFGGEGAKVARIWVENGYGSKIQGERIAIYNKLHKKKRDLWTLKPTSGGKFLQYVYNTQIFFFTQEGGNTYGRKQTPGEGFIFGGCLRLRSRMLQLFGIIAPITILVSKT